MQGIPLKATHDELVTLRLSGLSYAEIGALFGCTSETVRLRLANVKAADERFANSLAGRQFEDVHLKPAVRVFPAYRSILQPISLTGCAAALACV